ncbi:hypothetical protein KPG71_05415 [Roseovarius sp. PS-C2]|uniref:hypothetical protein n=1 Tax=Roseovarius sp. PS-C2 TaxID=2820814 RepID=UPI001C0D91B8|nr:hypothetical protein [Roseovarius sp. PS-C2]MBU3259449.1 hypothetical protein [Roseovarius sp. PS-C2]MDW3117054.1 hypothetical protein [Roseovarius pacificus]
MADLNDQLAKLKDEILNGDPDTRHGYEPQLAQLIEDMQQQGMAVPSDIRCLHEELVSEAIEAQFDNMPV